MDFLRLFDILPYQQARFPQKTALANCSNGNWQTFSTQDLINNTEQCALALLQLGVQVKDNIALITHTGLPLWNVLDFAIQQIGGVVVPIHPTVTDSMLQYILQNAQVKYVFVSNEKLAEKVNAVRTALPQLQGVLTFDQVNQLKNTNGDATVLAKIKAAIAPDDLATIIYTSGTTGEPKGVMLSHHNIVSNVKATIATLPICEDHSTFSFLPLSHIFERMVVYSYLAVGASIYYSESMDTILRDIRYVRPHYFTSVPRLLEKMYDTIQVKTNESNYLIKKLAQWAIKTGEANQERGSNSIFQRLKVGLADLLVFRVWRKILGGRIEGVIVGAAAMQPRLGKLFSAANIHIREGYGLTETSPVIAFNRFEAGGVRFGTVGMVIPSVEVKIDQADENGEGEILVKGPNVMLGYYQHPEWTAEVMTPDGWFKTGDVGCFVHKRFLKITDRKKDLFKTSGGKYVAPQAVENVMKQSPFIQQCMVLGNNQAFVVALLVPSFPHLQAWCEQNNIHWTSPPYMVINPKVQAFYETIVAELNVELPRHEQVKKIALLHEEWTVENGELTPTLKMRRKEIQAKHQREIDELYGVEKKK